MSILDKVIKEANSTPVYGVQVGLLGSFFSDEDEFPISDISNLLAVAKEVEEKYGIRAYGFRRCYYLRGKKHFLDDGWVFFRGTVRTAAQVLAETSPSEQILRDNVRWNHMSAVINTAGRTFPFTLGKDIILRQGVN